ncbi:hypothetical protein [Nonomuraea sp. NPDC049480]|uniref:hypothetical protein n=1 Tax=Nonomuraea sp. NPDC049480 TaxID=3364353 RepID=UPI00378E5F43
MAVIHHTALKPTKLELLTSWLPSRPWHLGGAAEPELAEAGGSLLPPGATGHVAGSWRMPDGTRARGLFVVLHTGPRA